MNFGEMQRRVYAVLRDDQKQFIKDFEVEDWLNEAQNDLAHRLQHVKESATGTIDSNGRIVFPTGFVTLLNLQVGDEEDLYWEYSDDRTFHEDNVGFRLFDGYIETGADNADSTYVIEYVKEPATLSSQEAESELPSELHYKMVYFARAQALYKERETELADRYLEMYERGLPAHGLGVGKRIAGPLNLTYEKSPWDVDAAHRG